MAVAAVALVQPEIAIWPVEAMAVLVLEEMESPEKTRREPMPVVVAAPEIWEVESSCFILAARFPCLDARSTATGHKAETVGSHPME